jgi:hypothetical protein
LRPLSRFDIDKSSRFTLGQVALVE